MATRGKWENAYFSTMAIASVTLGALGITISLLALERSAETVGSGSPLGVNIPKVRYDDGLVLVQVRNPGEWHDIRDFVQPLNPDVVNTVRRVLKDDIAFRLLDYVCKNVSYKSEDGEWWEFPAETLAARQSDCDGSAILLCSLLRHFYPVEEVHVAAGTYRSLGHAWVILNEEILEPTFTFAHPVPDPWNYRPYIKFNDVFATEMWPGAMSGMFQLIRNARQKLTLMGEAQRG